MQIGVQHNNAVDERVQCVPLAEVAHHKIGVRLGVMITEHFNDLRHFLRFALQGSERLVREGKAGRKAEEEVGRRLCAQGDRLTAP